MKVNLLWVLPILLFILIGCSNAPGDNSGTGGASSTVSSGGASSGGTSSTVSSGGASSGGASSTSSSGSSSGSSVPSNPNMAIVMAFPFSISYGAGNIDFSVTLENHGADIMMPDKQIFVILCVTNQSSLTFSDLWQKAQLVNIDLVSNLAYGHATNRNYSIDISGYGQTGNNYFYFVTVYATNNGAGYTPIFEGDSDNAMQVNSLPAVKGSGSSSSASSSASSASSSSGPNLAVTHTAPDPVHYYSGNIDFHVVVQNNGDSFAFPDKLAMAILCVTNKSGLSFSQLWGQAQQITNVPILSLSTGEASTNLIHIDITPYGQTGTNYFYFATVYATNNGAGYTPIFEGDSDNAMQVNTIPAMK